MTHERCASKVHVRPFEAEPGNFRLLAFGRMLPRAEANDRRRGTRPPVLFSAGSCSRLRLCEARRRPRRVRSGGCSPASMRSPHRSPAARYSSWLGLQAAPLQMDSCWWRGSLQVPESGIRCLFLQRELHAKHHRVITASAQRRSTHTRRGSRVSYKTIFAITQSPSISKFAERQSAC
ncbi:hypothetical protein V5799_009256 [Amblyomma americanum]|uniref:Uncharacterized protein n=1 Tax=Amblyomma americanum TaxID=6943 RepID=A0AAQ4FB78_AMBAM